MTDQDTSNASLNRFVARIEKLMDDKAAIAADIKEVYSEAKGAGYDTKVMRAAIKKRAADKAELEEFEALLETYMAALGG